MRTIHISAIDSDDNQVRDNEVLVSRIIGWYTRGREFHWIFGTEFDWTSVRGPTTIISIDSGMEYEIAESQESFRNRLAVIVDGPASQLSRAEHTPSGHFYLRGSTHDCGVADCPANTKI